MVTVGRRIKSLREKSQLTQKDLGLEFGIKKSLVCMYESEERYLPVDILLKYSEKFGVSTDWILKGTDAEGDERSQGFEELTGIFASIKNPLLKEVAITQLRALLKMNELK